jgi:hypothetical protein
MAQRGFNMEVWGHRQTNVAHTTAEKHGPFEVV